MRTSLAALIFLTVSLSATASPLGLSGLGNGLGWNDGSYYTGYVTLGFEGQNYTGLCIDAFHDTFGDSWNAVFVPLADTAAVRDVMQAYFGITDPLVYLPKLSADLTGYTMLASIGNDVAANNTIQHEVWSQFAPGMFQNSGLLGPYTGSTERFGLMADANYRAGGPLEQLFLVDPPVSTPEPSTVLVLGLAFAGLGMLRRTPAVSIARSSSKPANPVR